MSTSSNPAKPVLSTQNRLTFTGYSEPDAYITLYDGVDIVGFAVTNALGRWSVTSDKLPDGLHALSVTATDVAGNTSAHSPASYVSITASADAQPKSPIATPIDTSEAAPVGSCVGRPRKASRRCPTRPDRQPGSKRWKPTARPTIRTTSGLRAVRP